MCFISVTSALGLAVGSRSFSVGFLLISNVCPFDYTAFAVNWDFGLRQPAQTHQLEGSINFN